MPQTKLIVMPAPNKKGRTTTRQEIPTIPCEFCEGKGRTRYSQLQDGPIRMDTCPICTGLGAVDYALAIFQALRIDQLETELRAAGKLIPIDARYQPDCFPQAA